MEKSPSDLAPESDASSTTQYTPKTGFTCRNANAEQVQQAFKPTVSVLHEGDIPRYDKNFLILERSTRRALTHTDHGLRVASLEDDGPNLRNTWLCVQRNNFMGFMNKQSRCFLGHDGKGSCSTVHAQVKGMGNWECFVPRPLPDGGYQILSPFWHTYMRLVVVVDEEGRVERSEHGDTAWIFEEI
ncbi:unnamed protein product [Cercospora beticola]|nr:unnamed protein product [Cercospora beticola]